MAAFILYFARLESSPDFLIRKYVLRLPTVGSLFALRKSSTYLPLDESKTATWPNIFFLIFQQKNFPSLNEVQGAFLFLLFSSVLREFYLSFDRHNNVVNFKPKYICFWRLRSIRRRFITFFHFSPDKHLSYTLQKTFPYIDEKMPTRTSKAL